jgi:catechol 2,3-dioxygenase-like lactoylglutathione lyase family enzyme
MLVEGVNHVALLTADTDRLHAFYGEVFGATVAMDSTEGGGSASRSSRSARPARSVCSS